MNERIITVITPTYNRAHTLGGCYESLKKQTCKLFKWLIIDDGSSDHTDILINKWIREGFVNITYHKKSNGGKASALNYALDIIDTEYIVCLDSDDTFDHKAIEIALNYLETIRLNDKYCGILALRTGRDNKVLGGREIPSGIKDITLADIENKYKIRSEVICFYKSSIMKDFRFPKIPNEKFISPAYLEYEISKQYKYLVSKDRICYCEYLEDGLTKNKKKIIQSNPIGYTLVKKQSFELAEKIDRKIKHGIMYSCGCILSQSKIQSNNIRDKITLVICYPFAWLIYLIKFKK